MRTCCSPWASSTRCLPCWHSKKASTYMTHHQRSSFTSTGKRSYIYLYMHTYIYAYMHVYMYIYTYIHIYTHIHTYKQTFIHIYTFINVYIHTIYTCIKSTYSTYVHNIHKFLFF